MFVTCTYNIEITERYLEIFAQKHWQILNDKIVGKQKMVCSSSSWFYGQLKIQKKILR